MDENKEKSSGVTPESQDRDTYRDEMDELVRVFKEELDKAIQDAEDAAETNDGDTFEVEGYNPQEVSLDESRKVVDFDNNCECCGERPRGTKKNPDSPYCEECEAILEKYPYDWKGLLTAVVTVGIVIVAVISFAINVPAFSYLKDGDKDMKNNKYYSAMSDYDMAVNCIEKENQADYTKLYAKRVVAAYKLLNMSQAYNECKSNIPDGVLKLPGYGEVKRVFEEISIMQGSATVIQNYLYDIKPEEYDKIIETLDSLSGKKIYEKNGAYHDETEEDYTPDGKEKVYICDEGWLNLYKYSAAVYAGKDDETVSDYLKKAGENSEYLRRLTSPLLAATYIGNGKYEEAEPLVAEVREMNTEGADYYMLKSMLFRYRDKDYQKGVDICVEGLNMLAKLDDAYELVAQVGYILSMQKTLNLVMLGKFADAYESAEECCQYQYDAWEQTDSQSRDLWAILALATNNQDKFNELESEIKEAGDYGVPFSNDVNDYKNGKITLEEIVMSGRYDLL